MSHTKAADPLLNHEYDGIREYDNPTPGWWHLLFWATIVFSAVYGAFFHFSEFRWSEQDTHARDRVAHFERLFGELGELEGDEATILKLAGEQKWLNVGQSVFARNCTQCHGAEGGGINGPNLTDDSYKNIRKVTDLFAVISEGIVDKGMPAWKNRMTQNERVVVSSYVLSLRGKNAAGGKPAEGDVIAPWPPIPAPQAKTE